MFMKKNNLEILFLGVAYIFLGIISILFIPALSKTIMIFLGMVILLSGVWHIFRSPQLYGVKNKFSNIIVSLIMIFLGANIVSHPWISSAFFSSILIFILIAGGLGKLYSGIKEKDKGSISVIISGAVSLILAGLLITQWPASAITLIGAIVAVELITIGSSLTLVALKKS